MYAHALWGGGGGGGFLLEFVHRLCVYVELRD